MSPRTRYAALSLFLASLLFACGGGGGGDDGGGSGNVGGTGNPADCFSGDGPNVTWCATTSGPSDAVVPAHYDYCLNVLNSIRSARGLGSFTRTTALDNFAQASANQLMTDNVPHGYFTAQTAGGCPPAFNGFCAENQSSPTGWAANATTVQIDEIVDCFMAEETQPAGYVKGHYEAIVCPELLQVGIGLVKDGSGQLFLAIEFSP